VRARETAALRLWHDRFARHPGVRPVIVPDPTQNPLDRLELHIDPEAARITAWDLADALAAGNPPVIVRDHEIELGYFLLDPCNLHPGEAEIVADRMEHELERARGANSPRATSPAERRRRRFDAMLRWPD
jgi:D-glucosaminate-6-phosphate ammonia-lyase